MPHESDLIEAAADLFDAGWLSEVLYEVKSGKEATVFCCRGGELCDNQLVAAKLYRPMNHRNFRNDSIYQAGRVEHAHNTRVHRALQSNSAFGQQMHAVLWLEHEWQTMSHLYAAGVRMPQPLIRNNRVLLMPFYGDEHCPAPLLHAVRPEAAHARFIVEALLGDVELMLDAHRVHGDLSPYNILMWDDEPIIIDFPQAIDPRLNAAGHELLLRDVQAICTWGRRHDDEHDAFEIVNDLWSRFTNGQLG